MKISNQHPIEFSRNEMGTPTLHTKSEIDFYYAMGFAHATDRGVQMMLMRILGEGQASDLLSSDDEMLEVDSFFRKMNWKSNIKEERKKFSDEELKLGQAYCDGVNAVILKKRPLEFKLIGYKPTPWTIENSILISRLTGYISLAQSQGEVERFFIQLAQEGLSEDKLKALFPEILDGCDFSQLKDIQIAEKIVPDGVKWMNMVSAAIASNNWIIGKEKSSSGAPILANDPHLETNRLPNIWHEMKICLNDRYFIGCTMPGMPACLIGRTNDLAWGATYTFMDAVDSWMEDCKDEKYRVGEEWHPFNKRTEIIKRKKKEAVTKTFYTNEHGVLEGDPTQPGKYLTTNWASNTTGHESINAIRAMFHAKTVEEGMNAIGRLEVSFSWVIADTQGDTGYQMSGKMPVRNESWNGFYPAPGWDESFNWKGAVPFTDLPRVFNPENHYFITCNQDLNEYGKANPINIAMGDYRFRRVEQLLKSKPKHSAKDFEAYQNDLFSIQAEEIMPLLLPFIDDSMNGKTLKNWDLQYDVQSEGASIFEAIYKEIVHGLLASNIGKDATNYLLTETGILADFYLNFDRIIHDENSVWFNNVPRKTLLENAVKSALTQTAKPWGETNKMIMTNMFFGGKLPKIFGFDKGPIALKGGRATVHQGQIYNSAGRVTSFTPSYRFVTDMATHQIQSSLAGGASGNRFSKYYKNEVENWANGVYKTIKGLE